MSFDNDWFSLRRFSLVCPYAGEKNIGILTRASARPYAGRMRWDALFDDLESQMAESDRLGFEAEVAERARVEMVAAGLVDRLRALLGSRIGVHLQCGDVIEGVLRHAGADALLLDDGPHQVLMPYAGVLRYTGIGRLLGVEPSRVRRSIGLAHSLRALARDRAHLAVTLGSMSGVARLEGVIDRVGKDHFDLALVMPGEARRSRHVRQVSTVPFAALSAVRALRGDDL